MSEPSNEAAPASDDLTAFAPRVLYTAYYVRDLERAAAFYTGVLGMQERMRFELPTGDWECVLEFTGGKGSGLILMWNPKRQDPLALGDGYSRLVLKVSDIDAAVAQLQRRDVQITVPPTDTPLGIRYAMFVDPDGYTVELMQLGKS